MNKTDKKSFSIKVCLGCASRNKCYWGKASEMVFSSTVKVPAKDCEYKNGGKLLEG